MRLAICVTVKNRSCVIVDEEDSLSFLHHVKDKLQDTPQCEIKPYFTKQNQIALLLLPKMLRSLMKQKKPDDDWVVIVVDYKSTDIDMKAMLEYELGESIPWHLETVEDYKFFDRGGGLAKAVTLAESNFKADAVFFCDADLYFGSRDVLEKAIQSVQTGQFYYPIFFSFALPNHTKGFWRDTSFGNFACRIEDYKKTEGWYHNISWGWEDRALADSIPEARKDREAVPGFYHQWHPFQWEFRVKEYPVKDYIFKGAAQKTLDVERL
jgi:glycosyltransferase involved in cell wall biosynthesis